MGLQETLFDQRSRGLKIVNHVDALENLRKKLELDIFPISSYEEIKKRNEIYRILLQNKEIRKFLKDLKLPNIPMLEYAFLKEYFNPKEEKNMSYFKKLHAFKEEMNNIFRNSGATNKELFDFVHYVKETISVSQETERVFADKLFSTIQKATKMQGSFDIKYKCSLDDFYDHIHSWKDAGYENSTVCGYRKNFYGLHNEIKVTMPHWIDKKIFHKIGFYDWYKRKKVDTINAINKENFYKDLLITEIPEEIILDTDKFIRSNILKYKSFTSNFEHGDLISFKIFFSYDGEKLKISLLNFLVEKKESIKVDSPIDFSYANLVDGSESRLRLMSMKFYQKSRILHEELDSLKKISSAMKVKAIRNFFDKGLISIDAFHTNHEYRFTHLAHLYNLPEIKDVYQQAFNYRAFVNGEISKLKKMARHIEKLVLTAEIWGLPLTMPTISKDNILSFGEIYPIHLIGRKDVNGKEITAKDLKPIKNLPKLNGQIVGLTGQNAGGKTVTHESIVQNLFLAQAGLPVFGVNFVISPKDVVGVLFLERGDGSTMQLQIRKTKEIFSAIKNLNAQDVLVVLDEVGTGTSHDAGVDYGKKVMKAIKQMNVSCIFTTQLSEVAKYAEEELNAVNYQLIDGHRIKPGIGKPNLSKLLESEGLDQFLNN